MRRVVQVGRSMLALSVLVLSMPSLLAALPQPTAEKSTADPAGAGRVISSLVIRTDLDLRDREMAEEFIHLREGDVFSTDGVRQSLLNLQGSGLFSDLEIFARPDGEGVEVTIAAWSNVLVDAVTFEGDIALRSDELATLSSVKVDGPLIESRVLRSVFDIMDRHEGDGFLESRVRADVILEPGGRQARVVFHIDSGPRSLVGSIEFSGDLGTVEPAGMLKVMESQVGERYWPQRVRRDADTLQRYLIRRDFRTARVGRPVSEYDWDTHEMHLVYEVELGPVVEVTAVGADLEAMRRQGLLPFLGTRGYDPALVRFSINRVIAWYQSEGYYHAEVRTEEVQSEDLIRLTILVEPGDRFRLTEVGLRGNDSFPEETLRRLMATTEPRRFTPGSGRLVDEVLVEDIRNLRSYYALQGFGQAVVGPEEVIERPPLSGRGEGELELVVPIEEGPRKLVDTVSWVGVSELAEESLAAGLGIQAGGPFHPTLLNQSVNELRARYRDAGFDSALVSSTVSWDEAERRADVRFEVLEGQRTTVRRLVVRGQQKTSPWVLRRAIDLEPGDPVSRRRLQNIQRSLYDLGIFSSVDVSLAQGELLTGERDVVVRLQEGDRHRISVGGGFDTEDGLRGLFGYSVGNLGGRAISLHLDTIVAQREELYRLLLLQPAMGGWRVPMQYSLFRTREEERNYSDAFDGDFIVDQLGGQVEATFHRKQILFPLLYTYKEVDNNVPDEVEEILFDRERAKVRISSLTAALRADKRDSAVNASEGRNTVLQAEYAFPVLSAEEHFLKLFAQQTLYLNMGGAGVLGGSLRLGAIESYRDTDTAVPEPRDCAPDQIPDFGVAVSERFFAGGRSTHRAYKLDTLGIPGETLFANRAEVGDECVAKRYFATGGNGLALFNLDYRYPFLSTFWATVFYDTGNIWADWRDIALSDFKDGLGVGVGWDSPIGPLRLEIGWKLDREEFEDPYQVFLSFGTAF